MLITKSHAIKKENSPDCSVREYPFPSRNLGIAVALIDGKYPEKGKVLNQECESIYYVLEGTGTVYHQDGSYAVQEGDAIFLAKNKRYRVEGKKLKILLPTAPARYFKQCEITK